MGKAVLLAVGNDYPRDEWGHVVQSPLSILAMGSYLAVHDVPVELIDVEMDFGFGLTRDVERIVCQRVARYLHDQADGIAWVGISQHSNASSGVVLAQEIRALLPETPIVFGGYFPSGSYRLLLRKYPFITAIVRGDGEAAALEISRCLAQGRSFLSDRTPNLAWRNEGDMRANPIQPMALDELPIVDFRLLHNRSCYQTLSLSTSRGCPFRCSYCLESGMRPYAEYPLDWVARQLEHMEAELTGNYVSVADPTFGVGRERTLKLCRIMREHRFSYVVGSRVDTLAPDLLPALREAGIEMIYLGMESASPATLLRMNKVHSMAEAERYVGNALEVLRACFERDVVPFLGLMIAFPGDVEADCQAMVEFVRRASQLRGQVAAQTGAKTLFLTSAWYTHIFDGSPLSECVEEDFPKAVLQLEPFDGERSVFSPSPELGLDTIRRYKTEIKSYMDSMPRVLELINRYFIFSSKRFIETHPELTDSQGVTVFCDDIRRSLK
jgi:radical SAM superfamily enzyme YgiQ (UPF0313 family)